MVASSCAAMSGPSGAEEEGEQRSNLIKLAADGFLDSHLVDTKSVDDKRAGSARSEQLMSSDDAQARIALTADNLGQIPEAELFAPGIRLPEHILNTNARPAGAEQGTHVPSSSAATSNEAVAHTGVPPELDPRAAVFRPGRPSAGSVFSVAAQPGSPRSVAVDTEKRSESQPKPESPAYTNTSSPSSEATYSSHATASGVSVGHTSSNVPPRGASAGRSVSMADSEAGSMLSDMSSSAYSTDVREQELAIEHQRMRERELLGGEIGIGGPVPVPFARLQDHWTQMRSSQSHRSISSAATVASSPIQSARDSDAEPFFSSPRRSPAPSIGGDSLVLGDEPAPVLS